MIQLAIMSIMSVCTLPALANAAILPADSIFTEQAYFTALNATDSTTFQREFEAEFLLLLHEPEKQMYLSLPSLPARKDFVVRYWQAANPNPFLPENDWLLDFLKRRVYARKNFPHPAPPFVDDRGKYYLKYGRPSRRYEDFGSFEVLPNETWSYQNVTRNLIVHFKREGKVYREIQNLVEILSGKKRFDPDTEAKVLIAMARQRAAVSPVFGRVFAKWLDLNTAQMDAQSFPASRMPLAIEWQQPHAILYAAAQHAKAEIAYAQRAAPPSAHDAVHAINELEFHDEHAQFRGLNGNTRVEISVRAPLKKNLTKSVSPKAKEILALEYRGLLGNEEYRSVSEDRSRSKLPVALAAAHAFTNAVGKLVLSAPSQRVDLTLQIKDEHEEKLGFARKELLLRDFTGSQLMLSDLLVLFEITNEEQKQILPTMLKQERVAAPYPFDKIRKALPVLCYFEIYNLHMNNYELTYQVTAAKSRVNKAEQEREFKPDLNATTISVTTMRPVTNDTVEELLALDMSRLKNGEYSLEVVVTDANDRTICARAQKYIFITD